MRNLIFFALLALAACVEPQRPFHFTSPPSSEDALDVVARVMASQGAAPVDVDRQAGILKTRWEDTGFLYGQVNGVSATVVRRFTVTVARGAQTDVTIRMDARKCAQGGYTVGDVEIRGACERIDDLAEKQQKEVDAMGTSLQQALSPERDGSGATPSAARP